MIKIQIKDNKIELPYNKNNMKLAIMFIESIVDGDNKPKKKRGRPKK